MAGQPNQSWRRVLFPSNTPPRSFPHFLAFDVETDPPTGDMRCACIYGEYKSKDGKRVHSVEETFYNEHDLTNFLTQISCQKSKVTTIVAFNLSHDITYLGEIISLKDILTSGSRFISAATIDGIPIIDISNHSGGSLDKWITTLNMNAQGIYKTEFRDDFTMEELVDHCKNDTKATWVLAEYFKNFYKNLGVAMNVTLASSALDMYRRKFMTQRWMREDIPVKGGLTLSEKEHFAYYGGRTEMFSRGIHSVQSYDVNSMYVSVMRDEWYPVPDRMTVYNGKNTQRAFEKYFYKPGVKHNLMIVHCSVKAPKSRVMVLPYRKYEKGANPNDINDKRYKLVFPWGEFSGWWTSVELRAALRYGYEITEVKEFLLYHTPAKLFAGYADYCYSNRLNAKHAGNTDFDAIWKLMGNGLYGKFIQKNPIGGGYSEVHPLFKSGQRVFETTWKGKKVFIETTRESEYAISAFPCIGAFITSYARLKLLEYLKRHESTVCYCDTDSVKYPISEWPEESSDEELGKVKYEPKNSGDYIFISPKFYGKIQDDFNDVSLIDYDFNTPKKKMIMIDKEHLSDHKWVIKGLGKPLGIILDCNRLTAIGITNIPRRFRSAMRAGVAANAWRDVTREMSMQDTKREWSGKDSMPLYIHE